MESQCRAENIRQNVYRQVFDYTPQHPPTNMKLLTALGILSIKVTILFGIAVFSNASAEVHRLGSSETNLSKFVVNDPGQMRLKLSLDPILCKVARARAADMNKRNYFSHTNPSGFGPNYLVRKAGYQLPISYGSSKTGNFIESILLTSSEPKQALEEWKNSGSHKPHLLGIDPFYRGQTSIGVGIYPSSHDERLFYYVFLSAPENTNKKPPVITLKDSKGKTITRTR